MDDPRIERADHARALNSLNRVNRLLRTDQWQSRELLKLAGGGASVLDLGCGGGGFLARLARLEGPGRFSGLTGVDRSAAALDFARSDGAGRVRWVAADARRLPLPDESVDVVTCSLFLHHFNDEDAVAVLREAARVARRAVLLADLARSPAAWGLTWLVTRLISRSWVFHVDGPRSVRAAFIADELRELARSAGMKTAAVGRRFPFRLYLSWQREGRTST